MASIGVTIASELTFTLYVDVYGFSNLIGHYLKVISFYLVYRAIIQTGLNKPYNLVFRGFKKEQEALAHSEERHRAVVETANDAIISIDGVGSVVHWNKAAEDIFGYSAQEAVGKSLSLMMPERFREAHEIALHRMASSSGSRPSRRTVEVAGLKKEGKEFPAELSVATWETREGKFFTGILRDITPRKRAQEALQSTLAELERSNAELQQFAYVASHDLQEPLRMISSYVQLLERRYRNRLDQDADDFITYAVDGSKRMQRLINGLLLYSRVGTHGRPFELIDCETVLDKTLANLRMLLTESGAQVTHDPLPTLKGDSTQLLRLFQNLIDNACKFRDDDVPQIHVSARLERSQWLFSVSDNGIGIDPEYADRIFIIFQRLHSREEFPGTGLGLAICKKIVERHGGRIWVDFGNHKGATFCFTIPEREAK